MGVIVWSYTQGGSAITDEVDHGDVSNSSTTTPQTLYVRHTYANEITDVGLYIREFSGTYDGDFTANGDLLEVLGWGTSDEADGFGGVEVLFSGSTWPVYDNKEDDVDPQEYFVFRPGRGDSEANAVTIPTTAGADTAGEIQVGETDVCFDMRIEIPANEDIIGDRLFDMVLTYTYTS